jgi:hypothetical protein
LSPIRPSLYIMSCGGVKVEVARPSCPLARLGRLGLYCGIVSPYHIIHKPRATQHALSASEVNVKKSPNRTA